MRRHNHTMLQWHHRRGNVGEVYPVHLKHDSPMDGPLAATAKDFREAPGFQELTHVALGARVIYNTTDCKATGATNSKPGTVTAVHLGEPPEGVALPEGERWVEALSVQLEGGNNVRVTRSVHDTKYPMGCKMRRSTFPVQLAYAQVRRAWLVSLSNPVMRSAVAGDATPGR